MHHINVLSFPMEKFFLRTLPSVMMCLQNVYFLTHCFSKAAANTVYGIRQSLTLQMCLAHLDLTLTYTLLPEIFHIMKVAERKGFLHMLHKLNKSLQTCSSIHKYLSTYNSYLLYITPTDQPHTCFKHQFFF